MKTILVIEDDKIFGGKLIKRLKQIGYHVAWLSKCDNAEELTESVKDVDLILLDLNLGEESALHGEGILELIKDKVSCPIIVMSAYDERIIQLFQFKIFTVVRKPIEMTLLINNIQNSIKLYELDKKASKSNHKVEYAIVTALFEEEFESLISVFKLNRTNGLKLGKKNLFQGELDSNPEKKIVATYQSEVGRADAGNLVTELINEYNPKYIFMTGVCGGSENTSFGDIIIAKFVFTIDKGKISDKGFLREMELVKMNEEVIRLVRENNKEILDNLKFHFRSDHIISNRFPNFNSELLKSFIDPMACSASVIDQENYFEEVIRKVDRKATAVEMESFGFARAVEAANSTETKCLIIKSVMDKTSEKNDAAKSYASFTSALYLKCLLEQDILQ